MGWADSSAGLAHRAIAGPGRKVWFDRIKRTDLNALVAVDTGGLHFSFCNPEQIPQREQGAARTDVFAPKPGTKKTETENGKEHQ